MPKISEEPLEAKQVKLFKSDLEYLREMYGDTIGVNGAIRTLVRTFVRNTRAKTDKTINELETNPQEPAHV